MSDDEHDDVDETERAWALDEAEDEISPQASNDLPLSPEKTNGLSPTKSNGLSPQQSNSLSPTTSKTAADRKTGWDSLPKLDSLEEIVLSQMGPPQNADRKLALPVILPQRRPEAMMGRGFVRAYAPILEEKGISQEAFLTFLKCLRQTNRTNPALGVVFAGAGIAGMAPSMIVGAASMAVQVVVGAAIVQQKRSRARTFLDDMNEKVFKPRGLYAVVMSYNPQQQRPVQSAQVDMDLLVADRDGQKARKIMPKVVSGESYGELELPPSAPLVYPTLDELSSEKMGRMKKSKKFVSDYHDRRLQMQYLTNNPDSRYMDLPEEQRPSFATRLADPNHPAFQGSWLTLFSGGKVKPLRGTPQQKAQRKAAKRAAKGKGVSKKDKMRENVLYLMIVDMPTEAEIEMARHAIEVEDRERKEQDELDMERLQLEESAEKELGLPPAYKEKASVSMPSGVKA